ncbi:MAG: hypothetical protein ACOZE5_03000 [Verrucomicrobiota bacterium]
MNTSRDDLSEVLQSWRVKPPADPDFRAAVWRRIGRQGEATWPAYLRAHTAAWALAAMLTIGVAGFAGRALAQARVQADREAVVVAYLTELDPRVQAMLKP